MPSSVVGVWRVSDRRWEACCTPLREHLVIEALEWEHLVLWARANGHTQAWLRNMLAWMELRGWITCRFIDSKWLWRVEAEDACPTTQSPMTTST